MRRHQGVEVNREKTQASGFCVWCPARASPRLFTMKTLPKPADQQRRAERLPAGHCPLFAKVAAGF
jgi:hypothetical protein